MIKKLFTRNDFIGSLKKAGDSYKIFVPVKEGDFHSFRQLDQETRPSLDFQNTRLSAKSVVYPQSERMFECSTDQGTPENGVLKEAEKDYTPRTVIGIRPCDAQSFHIVKKNFDNAEYRDPWWVRRFESTVLVGLGCDEPCPTCFCTSVGGGPFQKEFLDALLYDLGDEYIVESITQKGEDFLSKLTGGTDADDESIKKAEALSTGAAKKMTSTLPSDKLKNKKVNDLFKAPFWEDVAFSCINCGTCTFLCPTCWCFDIQDETHGKQADRIRNWDTCMSPLFTLEGSGHNPREKKFQRVRQRFMHKLKYYVDKYDSGVQCSGCGRCVRYCPVNIDIRKVAGLMNEF
jgi:NAD-dependent dihydropyrimidine dehydrogenase PreA subunit